MIECGEATAEEVAAMGRHVGFKTHDDMRAILAKDEDNILAAAAFERWTNSAATAHIWIGDARALMGGKFLRAVCEYVFGYAGKKVLMGETPASNPASIKLQHSIGFKEIARIPDGWDMGVDMVVSQMRADACPWYKVADNG